ncbi:MAG: DUF4382 domain-containing protein, partial [Chitinophagaceae bacterium]
MNRFSSLLFFVFIFFLFSCSQKNVTDTAKANLEVRLTDAPGNFDALNIDIRDVQYNYSNDTASGWKSLTGVKPGIYNLLDLVNDKDTLLANAEIETGRLQQLRLVLGPSNSIVVGGVSLPLTTPSAQQSGLKLNIQQDIVNGVLYKLLLDFDAAKSVVQTGNGKFILKPVIRTILDAQGGSIAGVVRPESFVSAILTIKGTDTVASSFTAANGNFLVK